MNIEELGISARTYSCLKRHSVNTTKDLCNLTIDDVIRIRNLGRRCLEELLAKMKELGLEFKGE